MQSHHRLLLLLLKSLFNLFYFLMKYEVELVHHCSVKGAEVRAKSRF